MQTVYTEGVFKGYTHIIVDLISYFWSIASYLLKLKL